MNQRKRTNQNRNAFTIVEILVVIGILVVVAVGVATIFGSVGDTVARGRKLSELNQFAARIERVMREDFERMTRDGFLVIVNKNADLGDDVQLFRGDQTDPDDDGDFGRPRRSDEIMFFARGVFETQRRAIDPTMRATSNEAAIYYGHGQKRAPDLVNVDANNNYFFNPQPWDNNFDPAIDTRLGVETVGRVNPNEFARDWSLLRHVTLLSNPLGAGQRVPEELFGFSSDDPVQRPLFQDSPRQIALQPAARSIFKSLGGSQRRDPVTNQLVNRSLYDIVLQGQTSSPIVYPLNLRNSGVVDIVTQDLATIRNELQALGAVRDPGFYLDYNSVFERAPNPGLSSGFTTRDVFEQVFYLDPATQPNPSDAQNLNLGRQQPSGNWGAADSNDTRRIRQWMIDALPSVWNLNHTRSFLTHDDFISGVRYEDIPTRLLFNDNDFADNDRGALERAYAEANQEMLGSAVFVPRCTEFVVEWSYGFVNNSITDPANPNFKRLIWYGLDRIVDSDNDGLIEDNGDDQLAAQTYRQRASGVAGTDPSTVPPTNRSRGASTELVVGRTITNIGISPPETIEAATFGFSTRPGATASAPGTYWPWPKLIRITMSLGDPNDRDIEQTYQVIFEVPEPN